MGNSVEKSSRITSNSAWIVQKVPPMNKSHEFSRRKIDRPTKWNSSTGSIGDTY
jgi:hypothetical protein